MYAYQSKQPLHYRIVYELTPVLDRPSTRNSACSLIRDQSVACNVCPSPPSTTGLPAPFKCIYPSQFSTPFSVLRDVRRFLSFLTHSSLLYSWRQAQGKTGLFRAIIGLLTLATESLQEARYLFTIKSQLCRLNKDAEYTTTAVHATGRRGW